MKTTNEIRNLFLDYFKKNNHAVVPSSSLVPSNDPTLMFTNAGMVQFKDVFTGKESRQYVRAASSQKCVRAGGKHNDLENVGHTKRHLTFFEMLGNFSFGDYFKKEAIKYAWDFITKELQLNKEKLYLTVYHNDDEAFDAWKQITGFEDSKIIKISTNDNFWSMGDVGPCGPCSEIFYDQGDRYFGGLPGTKDQDGDRYVEIWNLVFMEYEQLSSGELVSLPKKSIDTGMGLERIAAVVQGVYDNFAIDMFQSIINTIEDITSVKAQNNPAHRVIADHLRSTSFLIADGVMPSNEGRGYVLRRIIRRAVRYVNNIGYKMPLLHQLIPILTEEMGGSHPELIKNKELILDLLKQEEEMFITTLDRGLKLLNSAVDDLGSSSILPGDVSFKLHDTYGFPIDLTQDILKEKNIKVDLDGFNQHMQVQKERARTAWVGSGEQAVKDIWFGLKEKFGKTEFIGYAATKAKGNITALIQNNAEVSEIDNKNEFYLIANQTPFYGEAGGQLGDVGIISVDNKTEITVLDTQKPLSGMHVHLCKLSKGKIKVGDEVDFIVNEEYRNNLRRNHTATHLLHAALKNKLGNSVVQKGSLVASDKLRFDFSNKDAISRAKLDEIEMEVNGYIFKDIEVKTKIMKYTEALESGAVALFGEKYEEDVRVVSVAEEDLSHSIELCGGTHVARLGEIGLFKIISETSIAAGIRRIEAVTATQALMQFQKSINLVKDISGRLQAKEEEILVRVDDLIASKRSLEKELSKTKNTQIGDALKKMPIRQIGKIKFVSDKFSNSDLGELRNLAQQYVLNNPTTIMLLFNSAETKLGFISAVSKDLQSSIKANEVVELVNNSLNGKGGGSPLIAQGSSDMHNAEKIEGVLAEVESFLQNKNV